MAIPAIYYYYLFATNGSCGLETSLPDVSYLAFSSSKWATSYPLHAFTLHLYVHLCQGELSARHLSQSLRVCNNDHSFAYNLRSYKEAKIIFLCLHADNDLWLFSFFFAWWHWGLWHWGIHLCRAVGSNACGRVPYCSFEPKPQGTKLANFFRRTLLHGK